MSRLKELYKNEIVDNMVKKFGYKNIMEVPKLDKVVVNMGVGEAKENAKLLETAVKDMELITGQKAEMCIRDKCKKNTAYFGKGLTINKYTGSRGKSGSNDANPEYMAQLRKVFDENGVAYQTAELGKVDQGGGGTIAYIMANYGMDVIDSGVAVQNMHAPWEVASKVDIYEAYLGYCAFLKNVK